MSEKIKYEIEFVIQSSPQLLYQYISTPSGLSEWYSDNVNSRGQLFTFIWDDSEEEAKLLNKKNGERIKFRWVEDEEDGNDYFFELRIQVDEITKDVSLMVTDFSEDDEIEENKMLWENQVSNLKQVLGSS
ncbi:START-like domain-containing protein [Aquimarina addita]|uniref:START-like domain-containing protein n=1 Tax=Aquimarina addita TaxID=870485 RepID=A0ABP6UKS9_9FLAO